MGTYSVSMYRVKRSTLDTRRSTPGMRRGALHRLFFDASYVEDVTGKRLGILLVLVPRSRSRSRLEHNAAMLIERSLAIVLASLFSLAACARAQERGGADHYVASRPENLSWGWFPVDKKPVLTIRSGETVRIDTLTHAGGTQDEHPVEYLTGLGIPRDEILDDVVAFWSSRDGRPREGRSGHVITGPIAIEGAEPGDMLEVQIVDIETRVPWGINNTSATGGVFSTSYPGGHADDPRLDIPRGTRHVIRTGDVAGREVALFADDIHVPLAPFMGILAVAPAPVVGEPGVSVPGVQSSRPPGAFGGNLDVKDLKAGTTVYLPVFHDGALFYTGDPHGAQGDGEVSGTAIEQSLSGVFRFVLHKDVSLAGPRAETKSHYLLMGIDLDLDRATRHATWEVVHFLVNEKGLSHAKALSLASIAVDFRVSEVVDLTQVVTGYVPKEIFVR